MPRSVRLRRTMRLMLAAVDDFPDVIAGIVADYVEPPNPVWSSSSSSVPSSTVRPTDRLYEKIERLSADDRIRIDAVFRLDPPWSYVVFGMRRFETIQPLLYMDGHHCGGPPKIIATEQSLLPLFDDSRGLFRADLTIDFVRRTVHIGISKQTTVDTVERSIRFPLIDDWIIDDLTTIYVGGYQSDCSFTVDRL